MSVLDNYNWPDIYPKDVPPNTSLPADGFVYRAVKKIPPDEDDFLMTREEYPERMFNTKDEEVKSYGVSLFKKKAKLEDKMRRYKPLKSKVIAEGDLDNSLGVVSKPNKNGHLSLWKCVGATPSQYIYKASS